MSDLRGFLSLHNAVHDAGADTDAVHDAGAWAAYETGAATRR